MDPVDAVVLSELLHSPNRAILIDACAAGRADAEADQRAVPGISRLADCLTRPPRELAAAIDMARRRAEDQLRLAARRGFVMLAFDDPRFPCVLAAIDDPPPVLWVRGEVRALTDPAVAIVGARTGSPYACAVAERLGSELSGRGVTVVSGLARGVDGAAHRGALVGPGPTVAVLGSGVDVVYPREHGQLAHSIAAQGALVSELPPGTPPLGFHFPRRNRVISGLSRAVVVVEASERSGSLITARYAADQGREVMAVPGNMLTGRNTGSHALIKDGAKLVETADDILGEIGFSRTGAGEVAEDGAVSDPVLRHMEAGETYDLDGLMALSGLDEIDLLPRLLELELDGRVIRSGPGRFVRT